MARKRNQEKEQKQGQTGRDTGTGKESKGSDYSIHQGHERGDAMSTNTTWHMYSIQMRENEMGRLARSKICPIIFFFMIQCPTRMTVGYS